MKYYSQQQAVATCMARLYNRGLTTTHGGNISLRLTEDLFCITPSSLDKASLRAEDIAIVSFEGENLTPDLRLSIETEMHRLILLENPQYNAVLHAHPVFSSMLAGAVGDCPINTKHTAETWYTLGSPAVADYQVMGTVALARSVADKARFSHVVLMPNHGVLTAGKSLESAFSSIELLENAAKMTVYSTLLGKAGINVSQLSEKQCEELDALKH